MCINSLWPVTARFLSWWKRPNLEGCGLLGHLAGVCRQTSGFGDPFEEVAGAVWRKFAEDLAWRLTIQNLAGKWTQCTKALERQRS